MNDDFKLKKTRMIVVASIFWVAFSFYSADTSIWWWWFYGDLNLRNVEWGIFFTLGAPVWIYWAYYWINRYYRDDDLKEPLPATITWFVFVPLLIIIVLLGIIVYKI
jgi:hypothetical protein